MKHYSIKVTTALDGLRLDLAVVQADVGLSRRKAKEIIDAGGAYVNRKRVRIASKQVFTGDKIELEYNPTALVKIKTQEFRFTDADILYDDQGVIALNKPPGLPSQATRDQAVQHVVPLLKKYLSAKGERGGKLILVHRLDKETTGVILVARTDNVATWLTDAFRARKIKKTYHALCHGIPIESSFVETGHLSPIDKRTGDVRIVRAGGKPAETAVRLLEAFPSLGVSLLACEPRTGRSHQIRVHLEHRGLPIIGDKRYGARSRKTLPEALMALTGQHQFLHALELTFQPGPNAQSVTVRAPYPPNFAEFLSRAKAT